MSYRSHVDARLAAMAGIEPGGPWIECNSCGTRLTIDRGKRPPQWLLDGRAPRGWRTTAKGDGTRTDRCPSCRQVHADGCNDPFDDKHLDRGDPCPLNVKAPDVPAGL